MKFKPAQIKAVAKFDDPEFIANIKDEDLTMVKHLDILKKINQHGYLTTNSQAGRKTSTIYERAYIIGFMLKKDAVEFIKNMNIETDKNAIIIEQNELKTESHFDIALSIQKKNKWEIFTHMSTSVPPNYFYSQQKQLEIDSSEKVVYIFCWDSKWNRNASSKYGLFTEVLKILKTI
jgi:hypothetical protein